MDKLRRTAGRTDVAKAVVGKGRAACGLHCIRIRNFTVTAGDEVLIKDVSLHIHCGQLTTVIGRNGAGKSTLVKAILNEIPHEGTIEFRDIKNNAFRHLRIGYVPQRVNVERNTPASVYDLIASYASRVPVFLWKSRKVARKIREQLARFEAEDLMDKPVCDLSGGELQRVLLALATMPVPNLLILDEPAAGIDQNGIEMFYRLLDRLKRSQDVAIILVSHDLKYVEKYSDYVILLDKTIQKEGKPREVFSSEEFRDVFGSYL